MSCNNCFNGCVSTTSDQCVKYTGSDVPELGIETGDSLAAVESAIITFLVPVLVGTGIKPIIDPDIICDVVRQYLPACTECTGFTLNEILTAIIRTTCDIQGQIDVINTTLNALNEDYVIGCLTGVSTSSPTHDIVQAVITKLCLTSAAVTSLALDIATNYVSVSTINSYIAAYLASIGSSTLISNKMVPYCPIPFYGSRTGKFDITGAGIGDWADIYLCNGANGTPDFRGRIPVGNTDMGSTPFPAATDPAIAGNPTYTLGTVAGANTVVLGPTQIPSHTHTAVSVVTDPGHEHEVTGSSASGGNPGSYFMSSGITPNGPRTVPSNVTDITVATTIANAGGGLSHLNIQPSLGVDFIIYLP